MNANRSGIMWWSVFSLLFVPALQAANPVTFQVDMSDAIAQELFNAATDTVEARGSFSDWSSGFRLTNSAAAADIYRGTFNLPDGAIDTVIQYKFVLVKNGHGGESAGLQKFTLPAGGLVLSVLSFQADTIIRQPIKASISFSVNLSAAAQRGIFNLTNGIDQVWLGGNTLGWGPPPAGLQLYETVKGSGIYTNVWTPQEWMTGDKFEYRFAIWHQDSATMIAEESSQVVRFNGDEPVNAAGYHEIRVGRFFDDVYQGDLLSADTLVTFRVDMRGARTLNGDLFDPATQGLWLNGDFLGWWNWGSNPADSRMQEEQMAGSGIYWVQHVFSKGSPTRVEYKYAIDGADNEAATGRQHLRYIGATGAYVMPVDTFGSLFIEPTLGELAVAVHGDSAVVTWNGRPGLLLQSTKTILIPSFWQNDSPGGPSSAGRATFRLDNGPVFFRLWRP